MPFNRTLALLGAMSVNSLPQTVADFWNPNSKSWNHDFITHIFSQQATQVILQVPIVPNESKEEYQHLNIEVHVTLPSQGPRSMTTHALNILEGI
jgi:hypothetical protein